MERPPPSGRWMAPSELGEYTYCPRAWWYGRQEALAREGPAAEAREEAFARGLQVQAKLQEAHLAASQPRSFPWGATLAILAAALVGSLVLWTFWW